MKSRSRKVVIVAALLILGAGVIQWEAARRSGRTQVREVEGTITHIDLATRQVSVDIIHPKTGESMEVTGIVPAGCAIELGGVPAPLKDLRPGDRFRAQGSIHSDYTITANWIHASRREATAPPQTTNPPTTSP